jgi:uncharacterized membrane protein YciS (DUF1049 family)
MTLEQYDLQNLIAIALAVGIVLAMIVFNGMDDGDVA